MSKQPFPVRRSTTWIELRLIFVILCCSCIPFHHCIKMVALSGRADSLASVFVFFLVALCPTVYCVVLTEIERRGMCKNSVQH